MKRSKVVVPATQSNLRPMPRRLAGSPGKSPSAESTPLSEAPQRRHVLSVATLTTPHRRHLFLLIRCKYPICFSLSFRATKTFARVNDKLKHIGHGHFFSESWINFSTSDLSRLSDFSSMYRRRRI